MESYERQSSYVRGEKGPLGVRLFFKGVIYLVIFQLVLLGVPFPVIPGYQGLPEYLKMAVEKLPEPLQDVVERLDLPEAHAEGEVEFVSTIKQGGDEYSTLATWQAANQVD